ncbi:zinc-binding alcohol dehydrogenase family protein [Pigmentiphaga litoralis]|uniref:Zinc-type alcohol dehydrogenase-like protein n=1 Tax=Pigmentiphaga litoralis TaxID=516702 RepID=A0A7Y9LLQ7_9BURK|nr:zinc-binding alcohol dehydrogenase family protein [Pigmentiphaga litoralis]NYE25043.1 NADPH2:quinone reductase [Pigmentiphaga litoralis]NYE81343.1 NADPH2:quinone reductase [Pigmentiphaga litoralis]
MKAVGYHTPLPINDPAALVDLDLPKPQAAGRDLLVAVQAISVNPVDTKVRKSAAPPEGEAKVLGWDAVGIVEAVGPDVTLFKAGDAVYYAGSIARPGANAEFHLVDERIVGRKPSTLSNAEAAALPLTAITAWELLFDRLGAVVGKKRDAGHLLIIGGAGGVGSILIQLARRLTGLTVIATASRPETREWCLSLGAHHVIDHSKPFLPQLQALGIENVEKVASLTNTSDHFDGIVEVVAPQGKLLLIDDPKTLDIMPLKRKAVSVHWELMFTRSLFQTPDMIEQHHLLNEVADLIDAGIIRTTLGEQFGTINAENLKRAHALIESGKAKGKVVLEGF